MPTDREPHDRAVERQDAEEPGSAPPRGASPEREETSPAVVAQYGEDPGTVETPER